MPSRSFSGESACSAVRSWWRRTPEQVHVGPHQLAVFQDLPRVDPAKRPQQPCAAPRRPGGDHGPQASRGRLPQLVEGREGRSDLPEQIAVIPVVARDGVGRPPVLEHVSRSPGRVGPAKGSRSARPSAPSGSEARSRGAGQPTGVSPSAKPTKAALPRPPAGTGRGPRTPDARAA